MKNRLSKAAPYLSLILTLMMLFAFIQLAHHTGFRDVLVEMTQQFASRMWLVIAIFTFAFLFFAPGSLLSAVAFLIFGFWKTSFIISTASVLASLIVFFAARKLFHPKVQNWIQQKPKLEAIERALHGEGMYLYCLLRYIPIHFNVIVLLLAVSRIRFWEFFITCLALCPIWMLFTFFSFAADMSFSSGNGLIAFLFQHGLQIVFTIMTVAILVWISVIARRALSQAKV